MMTSNININQSPLFIQAEALNKTLLEYGIEQLEDEILAFEDMISNAIQHPEKASSIPFSLIRDKISKLSELQTKLAALD